ncbi:hypothetical protein, partial [Paraburkholderia sp. RL17-381-BIF-C]|uniref:hypothetical protein n=1 Tax=Paraburkholderia sp. RL17-381-BIF-C TaxID=3031635 RepID=UPI0038BD40D4
EPRAESREPGLACRRLNSAMPAKIDLRRERDGFETPVHALYAHKSKTPTTKNKIAHSEFDGVVV